MKFVSGTLYTYSFHPLPLPPRNSTEIALKSVFLRHFLFVFVACQYFNLIPPPYKKKQRYYLLCYRVTGESCVGLMSGCGVVYVCWGRGGDNNKQTNTCIQNSSRNTIIFNWCVDLVTNLTQFEIFFRSALFQGNDSSRIVNQTVVLKRVTRSTRYM